MMNFNIKIFLLCPIPDEQKPINEYINLKQEKFTNLILLPSKNYVLNLFSLFLGFFVLNVGLTNFLQLKINTVIFSLFFSLSIIFLIFLTNFSNWIQIFKRFRTSRIVYEEGSWYDSQFWEKPIELIKNDKLITILKVQPIIQRLIKTLSFLGFLILFLILKF